MRPKDTRPLQVVTDFPKEVRKKLTMPKETDHLFCSDCQNMYKTVQIPDRHFFFTWFTPDAVKNDRLIMPVIRAFSAFIEWTTGTTVEWFIAKSLDNPGFIWDHFSTDIKYRTVGPGPLADAQMGYFLPTVFLDLNTSDRGGISTVGNTGWYAATNGYYNSVKFKTKALMALGPVKALIMMCHEFTAHFFDSGLDMKTAPHYSSEEPYYGHCTTEDPDVSKCLNGWITTVTPNTMNALPFFTKWYETHKYAPIKMYKPKSKPLGKPRDKPKPLGKPRDPPKSPDKIPAPKNIEPPRLSAEAAIDALIRKGAILRDFDDDDIQEIEEP